MNLPTLDSTALPDVELAVVLNSAARVLETEGRKAVGACVFGAGTRMMMTADALRRSANSLFATARGARTLDHRAFAEARQSLIALADFLWWERDRLDAYCAALARPRNADHLPGQDRQSSPGNKKDRWDK